MKINLITSQKNAACSVFYADALKQMPEVSLFEMNLVGYDVIIIMTYDHNVIKRVKEINPTAKVGIADPRNHEVIESAKIADFLIVDSIEMEDYWRKAGRPIFRYVEYPNIPFYEKKHTKKDKITIGYHGNTIHLDCMSETVTPALEELAKRYDIEFVAMFNGVSPTGEERWIPKGVNVRHIPWSMDAYIKELSKCDIGIAPNNLIMTENEKKSHLDRAYNYSIDDYSLRFKMPSNPGRFVVYGMLGIPVVADFYPSALQLLNGETGFVACSPAGWEYTLERLIESHDLRQKMGNSLQNLVKNEFNFSKQNREFLQFLKNLILRGN